MTDADLEPARWALRDAEAAGRRPMKWRIPEATWQRMEYAADANGARLVSRASGEEKAFLGLPVEILPPAEDAPLDGSETRPVSLVCHPVRCPACNGLPIAFDTVPAMTVPEDRACPVCSDPIWWGGSTDREREAFRLGYRDGQIDGPESQSIFCPYLHDEEPELYDHWTAGFDAACRRAA